MGLWRWQPAAPPQFRRRSGRTAGVPAVSIESVKGVRIAYRYKLPPPQPRLFGKKAGPLRSPFDESNGSRH